MEKCNMMKMEHEKLACELKKLEEKYGAFDLSRPDNAWDRRKAKIVKDIEEDHITMLMIKLLKKDRKHSPAETKKMAIRKNNKIAVLKAENANLRNLREELEHKLKELKKDDNRVTNGTRILLDKQKQIKENINGKFKCIQTYQKLIEILVLKCQKLEEQYINYLELVSKTPKRILNYETKTTEWTNAKTILNELKVSLKEKEKTLQGLNDVIEKCKTECNDRELFVGEVVFVVTDTLKAQLTQQDVELVKPKRQHLMKVLLNILAMRKTLLEKLKPDGAHYEIRDLKDHCASEGNTSDEHMNIAYAESLTE
ncbi:hypothetical protein WDU94_015384 [Cyamophila willieti]